MMVATLVGVGKFESEVRATCAAVVAESMESVALWSRDVPGEGETAAAEWVGGAVAGVDE